MAHVLGRSCRSKRVHKASWFGLTGCLRAISVSSPELPADKVDTRRSLLGTVPLDPALNDQPGV